jgi:parvulin-like peptidyl-prolyl isomerase
MNKNKLTLSLVAIAIFVMIGCAQEPSEKAAPPAQVDKVIAKVNGKPILESIVQQKLKEMAGQHSKRPDALKSPEMRRAVIDTIAGEMLILEGAIEAEILVTAEDVDAKIEYIKKQLGEVQFKKKMGSTPEILATFRQQLKESMMKQRFADSLVPEGSATLELAKKTYSESPIPYIHQARFNLRFIQSKTFVDADKIFKDISKSGFDKVAGELDKSGNAMVSGYGWTVSSMYSKGIKDGLRVLESGETGGPYEGKKGYYIFHVKEKQPERVKSFDEARVEIMRNIFSEKRRTALAHWLGKKRSVAKVEILDENTK